MGRDRRSKRESAKLYRGYDRNRARKHMGYKHRYARQGNEREQKRNHMKKRRDRHHRAKKSRQFNKRFLARYGQANKGKNFRKNNSYAVGRAKKRNYKNNVDSGAENNFSMDYHKKSHVASDDTKLKLKKLNDTWNRRKTYDNVNNRYGQKKSEENDERDWNSNKEKYLRNKRNDSEDDSLDTGDSDYNAKNNESSRYEGQYKNGATRKIANDLEDDEKSYKRYGANSNDNYSRDYLKNNYNSGYNKKH